MEKKWQAMLHEAADASFQKEIEVLAVMDSAAYSYVDLPQTALCTLSEKILLLPHQVIVLLFVGTASIYPQKTPKSSSR